MREGKRFLLCCLMQYQAGETTPVLPRLKSETKGMPNVSGTTAPASWNGDHSQTH
ncbi:hypothetical protein MalM25_16860 [Planctomycetes bacterium MalM25]|nr:hypothetical protein MalM25_16860 [Planctomycetes bacterium MalM25]